MCDFGSTYRCNHPPRHIWVIISRPSDHHGQFLFVNLTTYNNKCVDDTCLLDPCDYQFLTHRTTVAYSRGHIGNVSGLGLLVEAGDFSPSLVFLMQLWPKLSQARAAAHSFQPQRRRYCQKSEN